MLSADPTLTGAAVTAVVALITGLFGGGSLVALLRVSADRGKVVIEAAQGAVVVQTSVIDDLQTELARVKTEMQLLRDENTQLRRRILAVEQEQGGG